MPNLPTRKTLRSWQQDFSAYLQQQHEAAKLEREDAWRKYLAARKKVQAGLDQFSPEQLYLTQEERENLSPDLKEAIIDLAWQEQRRSYWSKRTSSLEKARMLQTEALLLFHAEYLLSQKDCQELFADVLSEVIDSSVVIQPPEYMFGVPFRQYCPIPNEAKLKREGRINEYVRKVAQTKRLS